MKITHLPQGADLLERGVRYRVWARHSLRVEVEIFTREGALRRVVALATDASGYFSGIDDEGRAGDLYKFKLDGGQSYPDPASRWQPLGVHGFSQVIDPAHFRWTDEAWKPARVARSGHLRAARRHLHAGGDVSRRDRQRLAVPRRDSA